MTPKIRSISPQKGVQVTGFWRRYHDALTEKGLLHQWNQILETGRLENFYRAKRGERTGFKGYRFNDSDVYKWLEACAYLGTQKQSSPVGDAMAIAVQAIAEAQCDDGYLNTWVQTHEKNVRFLSLANAHELYCLGHLIEAAVALEQCGSSVSLMSVAKKAADMLVREFGPDGRSASDGHPEIELALHRLSRLTKIEAYAKLADRMIANRGSRPSPFELELQNPDSFLLFPAASDLLRRAGKYCGKYAQDHLPIAQHETIDGHSVRAAYLYAAAAISAHRNNDSELKQALQSVWNNTVDTRMYLTGGIGSSGSNEGFTTDFDLPNESAYCESCASIALVMWGRRMFELTADAGYIDIMERAIFNGVLSGISPDTCSYFYDNPLDSRKNHARKPWFECACCPPNLARFIGSITKYGLWTDDRSVYIGIPISGEFKLKIDGQPITLSIECDYPKEAPIKIRIKSSTPTRIRLCVRIPEWAEEVTTELPGLEAPAEYDNGFAVFDRVWSETDELSVSFEADPLVLQSHSAVLSNAGRVAYQRGPTVYCGVSQKIEKAPQLFIADLGVEPEVHPDRLRISGRWQHFIASAPLYSPVGEDRSVEGYLDLIAYCDWADHGEAYMQVWLRSE